jgi:hypothetical protein
MLRAKIWTFSTVFVDFHMKKAYFRDFRRATLKSAKGRRLPMAELGVLFNRVLKVKKKRHVKVLLCKKN